MARITRVKTKIIPVPNDPDNATIEFRLLKPGQEERLDLAGAVVGGTIPNNENKEVETTFTVDPVEKKLVWLDAVFESWTNFYDKDAQQTTPDKRTISYFLDELSIQTEVDKKTVHLNLYDWAVIEYDKYKAESAKTEETAAKN